LKILKVGRGALPLTGTQGRVGRKVAVVLAVFCGLLVCGTAQGQMRRVSLDDALFQMPAYTMNVPAGWKYEGTVRRDVGCSPGDAFQAYRLSSADGGTVIQVRAPFFTAYPAAMIQGMNFNGCGVITPSMATGELLTRYFIPKLGNGARVVSGAEAVPNVEQWMEQFQALGSMPGLRHESSRVKIAYTEGGKAYEAWIVGLSAIKQMDQRGGGFSSTVIASVRAPQGHLAEAEKNLDWALKVSANPAWVGRERERMQQAQNQSRADGERTRAAIAAQGQANINSTTQRTQQTIDSIHATGKASSDAARESENARHSAAVGTADHMGDRPTTYYHWRNTATGATRVTNNSTNPGPNWVSTD